MEPWGRPLLIEKRERCPPIRTRDPHLNMGTLRALYRDELRVVTVPYTMQSKGHNINTEPHCSTHQKMCAPLCRDRRHCTCYRRLQRAHYHKAPLPGINQHLGMSPDPQHLKVSEAIHPK